MKRVIHIVSFHQLIRGDPYKKGNVYFDAIDKVLTTLSKNPHYKALHLGAQSKLIEDYLKTNPDKREKVIKYIREGKLFIGPWYVLPNELIASGETLIRNLLLGHQVCRDLGGVMKIGYLTLACGLNSQIPQIFSGFNIDTILFPYLNDIKKLRTSEFIWEGSDNTQVLSTGFYGIGNDGNHYDEKKQPEIGLVQKDLLFSGLQSNFILKDIESAIYFVRDRAGFFLSPHILLVEIDSYNNLPEEILDKVKNVGGLIPDEVNNSSLYDYVRELKDSVDFTRLNIVKREFNNCMSNDSSLLRNGYSLSYFQDMKQKSFEAEIWLRFFTEPWSIIADHLGNSEDKLSIKEAWISLIHGQSLGVFSNGKCNQVYNDIRNHFQTSIELSKDIFNKSTNYILNNINLRDFPDDGIYFVVLNVLPFNRSEILELLLDIPLGIDCDEIAIKDLSGKELHLQIISREEIGQVFKHSSYIPCKHYRCLIELRNLPAMGYKTFQVVPTRSPKKSKRKSLSPTSHSLENDYLKVDINENGTFNVFSKETGSLYSGLGYFLDEGDLGISGKHKIQPVLTTELLKPSIKSLYNGSCSAAYKIDYVWDIPSEFDKKAKERSLKLITTKISTIISLNRLSKCLNVVVSFINKASDHTLKICFPIDFKTDCSYAGGRFDIISRRINTPKKFSGSEKEPVVFLMNSFVGISRGDDSFAVIADGLTEYEILQGKRKVAAITLLREIGPIKDPVKNKYHLSFYPHLGHWESGQIINEAYCHNIELKVFQQRRTTGNLPTQIEFLKILPDDLIFSTLKNEESGEGIVLRLFNPTNYKVNGEIFTYLPIRSVRLLSLEELVIDSLELDTENHFTIPVNPKKIITLRLTFYNSFKELIKLEKP